MRHRVLVFVLVTALAFAGCMQDDGGEIADRGWMSSNESGGAGNVGGTDGEGDTLPMRFSTDDVESRHLTESGLFSLTDHCFPLQCLVGEGETSRHAVDVSALLPLGVPMRLDAQLDAGDGFGAFYLGHFESGGVSVYQSDDGEDGLYWAIVARTAPADTLTFVVEAMSPEFESETQWHLEVTATPYVAMVPPRVIAAFPVADPQEPPRVEAVDGELDFLLWGPDDVLLGRFDDHEVYVAAVRASGARGDHVIMPFAPPSGIVVSANASAPGILVALAFDTEYAPFQSVDLPAALKWTIDVDKIPVAVGLVVNWRGLAWYTSYEIWLESPTGVKVGSSGQCGICLHGGGVGGGGDSGEWTRHTLSAGSLVPGAVEASFEMDGGGFDVAHFIVRYAR